MDLMRKSNRYRTFLETHEDADPANIASLDLEAINESTGFDEVDLRLLFGEINIDSIDENNYAVVLEMLDRYEFDSRHLIIKELSRRCRMNDDIYDIEKLAYNEETGEGNETIKSLIENHTCICIEDKCPNRSIALERKHYYCLRGLLNTFTKELEWLTENKKRDAIAEMTEMGIITITDIFNADKKYAIREYPEMAYDYITENPDDTDTIMYFIEVLREDKKDAPQNFKLLKVLVDNGYVLSDNDRRFLFDYGQGNDFYRKEITDLLLYQDAYTAIKKNPGANKQKIQNLIQDLTRGRKDAPQDFKLIQILVDNGYILTDNDKKYLNIFGIANKEDALLYDQINRLLNPPEKK